MKAKIFLLLFALPFLGVGIWMTSSIGTDLADAWQMQHWTQVNAKLIEAGYETHRGDDSDTYNAYARYSYQVDGQAFTNDRVSISAGADNVGSYQKDIGNRLSGVMARRQSVVVYVNPQDPADSIIDRNPRWAFLGFKAIFMLVFGGAGLLMLVFGLRTRKSKELSATTMSAQPWLENEDWQTAVIKSSSKATMYVTWVVAAFWNLISAPLPFVLYTEVTEKENYLALVGLLFPLVGIGLIASALRRTLEWRRFGPAPVTLDPFPGSIGGHAGGTIDVHLPYDSSAQFSLTLTNLYSTMSGSGKNRSRSEKAKWQDSQLAHAGSGPLGTRLSFRFDVPEGLDDSDAVQSADDYHRWRLNLRASLPGTDVDRDYEIPVYATREQSRELSKISIRQASLAQDLINDAAVRRLFRLRHGVTGKSMRFPMGRNIATGTAGAITGAIFASIGGFLLDEGHMFMGIAFGFVGSLVLELGLYSILNSLEISQDGSDLRTVRRVLGIPVRRQSMRRYDIALLSKESTLQTQSGGQAVMHYSVFAIDLHGKKMKVGEGFRGAGQAEAAMRILEREFGISRVERRVPISEPIDDENLLAADS